ncbi:HAD-IA family hydrolase [Bacillus sp. R86525]|uniref:HAD-IA family hydrolase n=1 Tax=Bacillus sp. R86525 TaxID=3101709 RepID=UPI0036700BC7
MNKAAVIWDLDGTLIDSYEVIVCSIYEVTSKYKMPYDKITILNYIKNKSVQEFLIMISIQYNIDYKKIKKEYSNLSNMRTYELKPLLNAEKILKVVLEKDMMNFIYTHKGSTTLDVLKNNGLIDYFDEIITSDNGFKRKPSPEALRYLIDKYSLKKESTYYIGDRSIDIECAKNAGVKSVLISNDEEENIDAEYVVGDLLEIQNIILHH